MQTPHSERNNYQSKYAHERFSSCRFTSRARQSIRQLDGNLFLRSCSLPERWRSGSNGIRHWIVQRERSHIDLKCSQCIKRSGGGDHSVCAGVRPHESRPKAPVDTKEHPTRYSSRVFSPGLWRGGWDSNPRRVSPRRFSRPFHSSALAPPQSDRNSNISAVKTRGRARSG